MMDGDFLISAALSMALAKLALRYKELEKGSVKSKRLQAESMLIMTSLLRFGRSGLPSKAISEDDAEIISLCLQSLACPATVKLKSVVEKVFTQGCRDAFGQMLSAKAEEETLNQKV